MTVPSLKRTRPGRAAAGMGLERGVRDTWRLNPQGAIVCDDYLVAGDPSGIVIAGDRFWSCVQLAVDVLRRLLARYGPDIVIAIGGIPASTSPFPRPWPARDYDRLISG